MNFFIRYVQIITTAHITIIPRVTEPLIISADASAGSAAKVRKVNNNKSRKVLFFIEQPPF